MPWREGMVSDGLDPAGVYFGTTGGMFYASTGGGAHWPAIGGILP